MAKETDKQNKQELRPRRAIQKTLFWKNKWIWLSVLLLIAGGIWYRNKSSTNKKLDSIAVKRGSIRDEIILSGKIKAVEHAQLKFQTSGEIAWIGVKEGDWVKKGQYLLRLDPAILQSQYEQAVATLRKTQATVDNVLDQVKDHDDDETPAQKDLRTTAEANRDSAYRAVEIARANLKNGYLKAPFAGLITNITLPFSGINTTYSQPQIEIINPQTMYFDVQADQTEIKDLKLGQTVFISLDSYPDEEIEGKVESIAYTPSIAESGTVYQVKISFANLDTEKYRVGMTGDASFILAVKDNVLYIPPKYLNADKNGRYVKLSPKNDKVYVEVGIDGEKKVEIRGGVKEGDLVYD